MSKKQLQKEIEELRSTNKQQQEMITTLLAMHLHSTIRIDRMESWAERVIFI